MRWRSVRERFNRWLAVPAVRVVLGTLGIVWVAGIGSVVVLKAEGWWKWSVALWCIAGVVNLVAFAIGKEAAWKHWLEPATRWAARLSLGSFLLLFLLEILLN